MDDEATPFPATCPACSGTFCCPECHPVLAGYWICDGCRGQDLRGCGECDGTAWVLCEECEGADGGCDVCVPTTRHTSSLAGASDPPVCEDCGDTEVCQHCVDVPVTAEGLRRARERAAWSWAEAGRALGLAPEHLQAIEDSQRGVEPALRIDRARRLAQRAAIPVEGLSDPALELPPALMIVRGLGPLLPNAVRCGRCGADRACPEFEDPGETAVWAQNLELFPWLCSACAASPADEVSEPAAAATR